MNDTLTVTTRYGHPIAGLTLRLDNYQNNNSVYIGLYEADGCPFATLTVNLDYDRIFKDNEDYFYQFIDTNNFPQASTLVSQYHLGEIVSYGMSGRCTYPLVRFDRKQVNRFIKEV